MSQHSNPLIHRPVSVPKRARVTIDPKLKRKARRAAKKTGLATNTVVNGVPFDLSADEVIEICAKLTEK